MPFKISECSLLVLSMDLDNSVFASLLDFWLSLYSWILYCKSIVLIDLLQFNLPEWAYAMPEREF